MFISKCVKLVLNGGGLNINARHTFQTFVKENEDKFDFPSTSQCDCVGMRHKKHREELRLVVGTGQNVKKSSSGTKTFAKSK